MAFIGDENAICAPAFLERNGAALWSKLPPIKYIALIRTCPHKQNGYARKLAACRLGFGVTSCSAERGKLKPHPMCRSGLRLPVFNRRHEQPPSPYPGDRSGNRCRVSNLRWNNCFRHLDCRRDAFGRLAFGLDACGSNYCRDRNSQPSSRGGQLRPPGRIQYATQN